ncbi:high frequency lysogenization protein HflD [Motilimonas cestriensis]|uniref:High frequency lysogenization protein HflD homolog n=1 Tax=Motilimonas cestriensis TaxID=2742685 RepID=A0ABS8WDP7_9GAMM|nr:high frequency lysogenization protein HflD [Motilimonas cestriensis]MCE2595684.1 high frequency lysogenization protein HflD [Motilimonas cestriensis]
MSKELYDRTIAFAGIWQAASLVEEVARTGNCNQEQLSHTLNALLVTNPDSTLSVYGELASLKRGFNVLVEQLENQTDPKNIAITRYVIGLLALEKKLAKRNDAMNVLAERITQVKRQTAHFELVDEQILGNLADIYSDVISPLGPRIQVQGNPDQLKQTRVQQTIRALLLSGIRASVLWRQVGGKRRHIIFSRKKMIEQAKINLARI